MGWEPHFAHTVYKVRGRNHVIDRLGDPQNSMACSNQSCVRLTRQMV